MRSAPLALVLSAFLCAVGCSDGSGGGEGGAGGLDPTGGPGSTTSGPGSTTSGTGSTTGDPGSTTSGPGSTTSGTGGDTTASGTGGAGGDSTVSGTGGDSTTSATGGDSTTSGTGGSSGPATRTPAASANTLREAGEKANPPILIGAAISAGGLNDGNYARVAAAEHNYVTAENEMKWDALEPNPGSFQYGNADRIVNWARQNNMKVKGHTLIWHSQLPGWVNGLSGRQNVEQAMRRHIENVMGHFKDRIKDWDVVNEAVVTNSDTGVGNPKMRDTVFYRALGEEYLDLAFKIAREQDPTAKLYYNDYSIDARNEKADFVYNMIKRMVERGVPIDGVGFQMHIGPPNNVATGEDVAYNLKRFADLGLEVLISEMDINRCGGVVSAEQQLTYYHDIVEACFLMPQCVAITFWGINDGRSWLNSWSTAMCNGQQSSQSLLFNDQYQKKETYNRVMAALLGR